MTSRLPLAATVALVIGAGGFVAACGSTTASYSAAPAAAASSSSRHATTLRLSADPHGALRFTKSRLSAHPGTIKLVLSNPSSAGMPHAIAIKGHGSGKVVSPGGTSTLTVTLKRGTYKFLCPVPGHAQAGMTGTLTVR